MSWIKVRTELPNSVKILKLQRILGCSRMEAVGLAVSWFAWVDAHCDSEVTHLALPDFQELLCPANASSVTTNATCVTTNASSVTTNADSVTRDSIFMAFQSIGWIALDENGEVLIIDFEKHNGENAKRRAQNAKRVAKHKTNARCVTANAGSVTKNEENAKPLTQVALPLTQDALPLTQVALPREEKIREDKIREDKNNNISLMETSNQSYYVNNNTEVLHKEQDRNAQNAQETAFNGSDVQMFGTKEKTPNNAYSVANNGNSNTMRSTAPCTIVEIVTFMSTYFPHFTEDQQASIARDFFIRGESADWRGVTNWKHALQKYIQSLTITA